MKPLKPPHPPSHKKPTSAKTNPNQLTRFETSKLRRLGQQDGHHALPKQVIDTLYFCYSTLHSFLALRNAHAHINDTDLNGKLIENLASQNRKVVLLGQILRKQKLF